MQVRQTGHEEPAAAVDALRPFRDDKRSGGADIGNAAIFRKHCSVGDEAIAVHRHHSDINERDRPLLTIKRESRKK